MLVYPALDIFQGSCVRLVRGDFSSRTVYSNSPSSVAAGFVRGGLPYLHIVDLEGAKEERLVNGEAIRRILSTEGVRAEVGGGIRTREDITTLLGAGADRIVIGSSAVASPHVVEEWMNEFGSERFVIAVDIIRGTVAHKGWLAQANLTPSAFIQTMVEHGARTFLCTSIDRDGMLTGPNVELYAGLTGEFPELQFIASGGVGQRSDLERLSTTGCAAVVVGKALYEGRLTVAEAAHISTH
jgi:phosphoribosylformimino-5-aminoimidazole carboxamide ribotide isomerase